MSPNTNGRNIRAIGQVMLASRVASYPSATAGVYQKMAIYDTEEQVEPVLCVEYFGAKLCSDADVSCVSLGCLVEVSCFAAL